MIESSAPRFHTMGCISSHQHVRFVSWFCQNTEYLVDSGHLVPFLLIVKSYLQRSCTFITEPCTGRTSFGTNFCQVFYVLGKNCRIWKLFNSAQPNVIFITWHASINFLSASWANDLNASNIGLYPVQRQIFPPNEFSTSSIDTLPFFDSNKLYMFITIPGEQYPHWVPFKCANRFWIVWYPSCRLPTPSTVVILKPWHENTDVRH